jgi:hypothetical protein
MGKSGRSGRCGGMWYARGNQCSSTLNTGMLVCAASLTNVLIAVMDV